MFKLTFHNIVDATLLPPLITSPNLSGGKQKSLYRRIVVVVITTFCTSMQSMPITTNVVSSNPVQAMCTPYSIMCDKVCQRFTAGRWFSPCTAVSATNKTDCHDIAEILLKVALNTPFLPRFSILFNYFIEYLMLGYKQLNINQISHEIYTSIKKQLTCSHLTSFQPCQDQVSLFISFDYNERICIINETQYV